MPQRRQSQHLEVAECDVRAPGDQRAHLGRQDQRLHPPRAAAVTDIALGHRGGSRGVRMCSLDEPRHVGLDVRGDLDLTRQPEHLQDLPRGGGDVRLRDRGGRGAVDNLDEILCTGKLHAQFEEEPVQLRLRQRIGPLHFDRILSGQHKKRLRQRVGSPGRGHGMLLHRLQQRRLCLRRGAVDLVGQQDLREDRPTLELEVPAAAGILHHHVGADDVGRHQVGRELDARESQVERLGQGLHQQRLPQSRNAFQQHMPTGQQRNQHVID